MLFYFRILCTIVSTMVPVPGYLTTDFFNPSFDNLIIWFPDFEIFAIKESLGLDNNPENRLNTDGNFSIISLSY